MIYSFREKFPWFGGDLQTLRDTFVVDDIPSRESKEILIAVPSLPSRDRGGGQLMTFLDVPSKSCDVSGLVVLLHGLGGSTRRRGLIRMAHVLVSKGFAVLKVNLRGADPGRHLADGTYAAECNSDIYPVLIKAREIARTLREEYSCSKDIPLYGAGISLGGTILLNACLKKAFYYPNQFNLLDGLVCISSPLDLAECSRSIERPRNMIYQHWLLKRLVKQTLEDPFGIEDNEKKMLVKDNTSRSLINDIRSFDKVITAPRWGYLSVEDYYLRASPLFGLLEKNKEEVMPPTLFIQSKDDPWVPSSSVENLKEVYKGRLLNRKYYFILTDKGGHNGFHSIHGCWGDLMVVNWLLSIKKNMIKPSSL